MLGSKFQVPYFSYVYPGSLTLFVVKMLFFIELSWCLYWKPTDCVCMGLDLYMQGELISGLCFVVVTYVHTLTAIMQSYLLLLYNKPSHKTKSPILLFFSNVLAIPDNFHFHINYETSLSILKEILLSFF